MESVDAVAFYDGFRDRLVEDYRIRSRRVTAAIGFAKQHLGDARRLLDIGCGIGWSTSELTKPGINVTGIDISPLLIETAREMFPACSFAVADITESWEITDRFDAVVMVDVYEHIQRTARTGLHQKIAAALAGTLILTVPTPEALQYARDNGIELQPVDEDVTDSDVERLAAEIGGAVVVNRLVSIWRPNDYRHVAIWNG